MTPLRWQPRGTRAGRLEATAGVTLVLVAIVAIAIRNRGTTALVMFSADDPINPGGTKRSRAEIVQFMERDVMPWARSALGPLKGGASQIRCQTCHGVDAEERDWQMPSVRLLPQPDVREQGWELYGGRLDAQMRNAIYGYLAGPDKQARAAYMSEVVMPGMARLLHRPAYDFTEPYEYNRSRLAFGCYHCHEVK